MIAAAYSIPASLFRIVGGWASDKYGARKVMYWTFIGSAICTFLLSYPSTSYVLDGIRGPVEFRLAMGLVPFTILVFMLGFFMSLGKAAVYKHIPEYYPNNDALGLLSEEEFPGVSWFESLPEGEARDEAARLSNRAVARESVELVVHLAKNNLPYTGVLTADYTMVNDYSAKVFGVKVDTPKNDYNTFVPGKIPGRPHAGVLSSVVWLNRFPTTDTNRNRHRVRMVFEFFLATDIQALGSRPTSADDVNGFNPTMNDPSCNVCHSIMDPVAGTLQNFNEMGRYREPETWYTDMREPGFGKATLPFDESNRGHQWLAKQLVQDPRFALAPVHILYKGLFGKPPLKPPTDRAAPDYLAAARAYDAQQEVLQGIAQSFQDSNYNLKIIVRELVLSAYYRASNAEGDKVTIGDEEVEGAALWADVGTGSLLTPEVLSRQVEAVVGYPWRYNRNEGETTLLTDTNEYRLLYGGIDSDSVVKRITSPNGLMANIQKRMANEMACWYTAQDFVAPANARRLFPHVEVDMVPEDANGFDIPAAAEAIKANIAYLHQRLLHEYVPDPDELERTYQLFLEVWRDGRAGVVSEEYDASLPWECQANTDPKTGEDYPEDQRMGRDEDYVVRAWMAVVTYMLSDYKFLHG